MFVSTERNVTSYRNIRQPLEGSGFLSSATVEENFARSRPCELAGPFRTTRKPSRAGRSPLPSRACASPWSWGRSRYRYRRRTLGRWANPGQAFIHMFPKLMPGGPGDARSLPRGPWFPRKSSPIASRSFALRSFLAGNQLLRVYARQMRYAQLARTSSPAPSSSSQVGILRCNLSRGTPPRTTTRE